MATIIDKNNNTSENQTSKPDEKVIDYKKLFEPFILDTENIVTEIKNLSSAKKISIKHIDFNIISTRTFFKFLATEEWMEVVETNKIKFSEEAFLLNPELKIKQTHKVEFFSTEDSTKGSLSHLEISLGANKLATKVVAVVKKNLEAKHITQLDEKIIADINKKKIKAGVLVGVMDGKLVDEAKKIAAKIRVNGFLDSDHTIPVCEGLDPVDAIDDDLIYHYKKKLKKEDEHGRVDHAKRGYIMPVGEGEVIIEYIKMKPGKSGRNCQGRLIKIKEVEKKFNIDFTITDNIEIQEDDTRIKYIAKRSGYVNKIDGKQFDVQDNMEVDQISFRTTGSIDAGMDTNVKINIKESDIFKDAIGPGMSVETSELYVEGNIGSGAMIRARDAKIKGQTHQTSKIYSDKLFINVHKGFAQGQDIEINRLEGGKIDGENITVEQAVGGEINGRKVHIKTLVSNVTICASELIEVDEIRGNQNKFTIDSTSIKGFGEAVDKLTNDIKSFDLDIQKTARTLEMKKTAINKNKETVNAIKERIMELKKGGKVPPVALMKKLRDFQDSVNEYNGMLDSYKILKQTKDDTMVELERMQASIFNAKVIFKSPLTEYNEIKFKLIAPPIEVLHNTKDKEMTRVFTLKSVGDGEFKIERSGEFKL